MESNETYIIYLIPYNTNKEIGKIITISLINSSVIAN